MAAASLPISTRRSSNATVLSPDPSSSPSTVLKAEERKQGEPSAAVDLERGSEIDKDDPFTRFSPRRKSLIVATISLSAILAPLASAAFFPSIPNIAESVRTSPEVINGTVAIFTAVLGAAPLIWAPLSGFYGRRPIYLISLPVHIAGSLGVVFSNSLGALIATRVIQAIGACAALSVGAGTIGDIYSPLERGTAMGMFYLGLVLGPALAPSIAGLFQQYTRPEWRSFQALLAAAGGLVFVLIFFFVPDTSDGPTPHELAKKATGKRFVMFWFSPFRAVALLKNPNILLISLNSSFTLLATYVLLVPLTYTMAPRYGIENVALIGTLYLPSGLGSFVGSRLGGQWADFTTAKWIKKRGYRRPEDRLRSALIGGLVLFPAAVLGAGWTMETGKGGLALPCVFLFLAGVGQMFVLASANTYCVDINPARSSETIAITICMRYFAAAGASAGILPLVRAVGVGVANTIVAALSFFGVLLLLLVIHYGEGWANRSPPPPPPPTTTGLPVLVEIERESTRLEKTGVMAGVGEHPREGKSAVEIEMERKEEGSRSAAEEGGDASRSIDPLKKVVSTKLPASL
ncbi:major facilitator superfamily domain-containing protein [Mrakia frigida]|uniref:major facilitator superfamily domain-containing protein n=1 Tax=Mrakia frigida TaxID=29902 RepID=UPI003FCC182A